MDISALTPQEKRELLELLELKHQRERQNRLPTYKPYAKQREFHRAGGDDGVRERLLMAGNQLGKTLAGSYEVAMHLTGRYPDWWDGAMFRDATSGWAASVTSQGTRDGVQRLLLGRPGEWGTGAIPADAIIDIKRAAHGVPDAVESVTVKHASGGISRLMFKTYDQGRERWQAETLNFVWFDEEPPEDIYFEGITRTNATHGLVWMTFTPLLGMSSVVRRFVIDNAPGTHITTMTIDDAEHYTPEEREKIKASYPAHEREARALGIPSLGSGRIYPVEEDLIRETPVSIPKHWPRIAGIDFGWTHPTAIVWLAWDRDTDTVHLYDAYRRSEGSPAEHSLVAIAKGKWIPVAWPHDGEAHDRGGGQPLADKYRDYGVNMLPQKATHAPERGKPEGSGGNSVEAGLMEILERMQTGRFRVAKHLHDWWEEFRLYHREDGKIVKVGDDLMDATRYAVMMLRKAKVAVAESKARVKAPRNLVKGMGVLG